MGTSTLIRRIRYGSTRVNISTTPVRRNCRILSYGRCFPRVYNERSNVANARPRCRILGRPISWQPRRRPRQAFWSRRPFPSMEWSRCSKVSTSWATGTPKTGACGPAPARGDRSYKTVDCRVVHREVALGSFRCEMRASCRGSRWTTRSRRGPRWDGPALRPGWDCPGPSIHSHLEEETILCTW